MEKIMDAIRYLKALADETRLRLALVLQHHELSVNELVSLFAMGQSRISRHLKILSEAGLLRSRRDGLWAFYSASPDGEAHDFLQGVLPFFAGEKQVRDDLSRARLLMDERAASTRHFFNAIADDWDTMNREVLGDFSLPATVLGVLPDACGTFVDLGCGTGEVLQSVRGACRSVIGVDNSPRMLELAQRRFGGQEGSVSLRIGELGHLPLRDGEADFACTSLVLHHISDPQSALREMARALAPGGRALLIDFDRHSDESMRTRYGDLWLGFSLADLTAWLAAAGLAMEEHRIQPVRNRLLLHVILARKSQPA